MGGIGSGRKSDRPTTEDAHGLDIGRLRKAGALVPGWSGTWEWTLNGQTIASVRIKATDTGLVVIYRARCGNDPWRDVVQPIAVIWSACRFGGQRPFLCCPSCGKRAVKLHLRFAVKCRACHGLSYPAQRESETDRAFRRDNKIRMKLGGEPGWDMPFPTKPKGMHWKTYLKMQRRALDAEITADAGMTAALQRIHERLGNLGIEGY